MGEQSVGLQRFLDEYAQLLQRLMDVARSVPIHGTLLVDPLQRAPFELPRLLRGTSGAHEVAEALRTLARRLDQVGASRSTIEAGLQSVIAQVAGERPTAAAPSDEEADAARAREISARAHDGRFEWVGSQHLGVNGDTGMRGGGASARAAGRVDARPGHVAPAKPAAPPPPAPASASTPPAPTAYKPRTPRTDKLARRVRVRPASTDGLLGATPAKPTIARRVPADRRWINAKIEDHKHGVPLRKGEIYTLALSVDLKRSRAAVSTAPLGYVFAPDEKDIVLSVQLDSADFDIVEHTRPLLVPRVGKSKNKARFEITPRNDGQGTITATFHKDGNFVQQMILTLQVGGGSVTALPLIQSSSVGRPIAAAATLQPRDLGISILPAPGGGFDCVVWGAVSTRARLPIQQAELANAIEQLRVALMKVITQRDAQDGMGFQVGIDIASAECDRALVTLASAGYLLYQKIFFHPAADLQANRVGEFLREQATRRDTVLKLQIVAQGFPIPWSLLYLADAWDETAVDWERFLGMRHIIEQIPLQNTLAVSDGTIASDQPALAISVNLNEGIDAQMSADFVARQARYWDDAVQSRARIRLTRRTKRAEVVQALKSADTTDQILYLYCHAEAAGLGAAGGPGASCLVLSGNERLTLADLDLDAPARIQLRGSPLVFINACESAKLSPMFYDGFVPYFMAKGARGVVGTECKTPALFAAEWARLFFDRFLAGAPLGALVLELRRNFYEEHGNPLGLLYGVYCDGDTQVAPSVRVEGAAGGVLNDASPLPPAVRLS